MESIVIERRITKWKNLKQRLGFKSMAMGCCGATWNWNPTTISILHQHHQTPPTPTSFNALNSATVPLLLRRQQQPVPTATGMNLAMALAAERNLRGNNNAGPSPRDQVKTLMRLIEETEGVDWTQQQQQQQQEQKKKQRSEENDDVEIEGGAEPEPEPEPEPEGRCCVCMERKKGAAFIPCGHTFCRVCSREVWLNRGSCPFQIPGLGFENIVRG
ncbi:hypothetical protein GQ457_06G027260 [Hibiscus cannabinus]